MSKVWTIGEALIDFIPAEKGVLLKQVASFEKAAGGAPANVACAVAKLGGRSGFIGKLGQDPFGDFLVETLAQTGVDISSVFRTAEAKTALAFVSLNQDGDRDFMFYRDPSADLLLSEAEAAQTRFSSGDILHFCSVDLVEAPVKYAHRKAIELVRRNRGKISFDPNVRLPLWHSAEACRQAIWEFLPLANWVKVSEDELPFITGLEKEGEAVDKLFTGEVEHVICTKGPHGAVWYSKRGQVSVPGYLVDAIDTTGAGDAFMGAVLYQIQDRALAAGAISFEQAREILAFANAAAAISTTRKGAVPSLPTKDEVMSSPLLDKKNRLG